MSIQFNLINLIWLAILLMANSINWNGFTIVGIIVTVPIYKLGEKIYQQRIDSINLIFIGNSVYDKTFYQNIKPHHIDIHIRSISYQGLLFSQSDYLKGYQQQFMEDLVLQHTQNCLKRPYCFCQKVFELNQSNLFHEYFVGNALRLQFQHSYVLNLYECYFNLSKCIIEDLIASYLHYLDECMQNKLTTFRKIIELKAIKNQNLSFTFDSILSNIQFSILKKENQNTINLVIEFEEQIQTTYHKMVQLLQKKNELVRVLSADFIDLITLEKYGNQLALERDQILIDFEKLYIKNKSNYLLQLLIQTYLTTLSFSGSKLHFQNKIYNQYQPELKFQQSSLKDLIFSKKSVALFVSIKNEQIGQIKKISSNIEQLFGYTKEEIQNQNCKVLMASNLGIFHDKLIQNMINKGSIQKNLNNQINPLLAKTKSKLLVPISLKLQITHLGVEDIGVSGLVTLNRGYNQNYIVLDLQSKRFSLRIEGFTQSIFQQLFQTIFYFDNQEDYLKISASKIFPLLPLFIKNVNSNAFKQENDKLYSIEMIGFFPFNSRQLLITQNQNDDQLRYNQESIYDYKKELINKIKKQEFSTYSNSLFQFQLSIQLLSEESSQYCQISINSFYELTQQEFQKSQIKLDIRKQFEELGDINFSLEEIDEYFGIQNITLNKLFSHNPSSKKNESLKKLTIKKLNSDFEFLNQNDQELESYSTFRALESDKRFISQGDQFNLNFLSKQTSRSIKKQQLPQKLKNNFQSSKFNLNIGEQYSERMQQKSNEESEENRFNSNKIEQNFDINSGLSIDNELSQLKSKQYNPESNREISLKNIESSFKIQQKISSESQSQINSQQIQFINISVNKQNAISPTSSESNFLKSLETNILSQYSLHNQGEQFQDLMFAKRQQQNSKTKQLLSNRKNAKEDEQFVNNKILSKYFESKLSVKESQGSDQDEVDLSREIKSIQNMSISTTSKSSAEKSKKKIIIHSIQKKKAAPLYILIKIFTVISILSIFSVMFFEYLVLTDQFDKQIRSFSYISWAMDARVTLTRTFTNEQFKILVNHPIFANQVKDKEKQVSQYNEYIQKLAYFYKQIVDQIYLEKRNDLVLIQYMINQDIAIKYFLSSKDSTMMQVKLFYDILFHYQSIQQYTQNVPSSPLAEAFLFQNFQNQTTTLSLMQTVQQQAVTDSFSKILAVVQQLLIIITVISGILLILSYNSFIYSQIKKTQILKLFSTLDPQKLHEMNNILIQSSQILLSENSQAFVYQGSRQKKSKAQKDILITSIAKKKKLTSQTNKLPLFNFKVYFLSFGIFVLILVYPIANLLITLNLISQSNNNQNLLATIQNMKAQSASNMGAYSLYFVSQLYPSLKITPIDSYRARFYKVITQNPAVVSGFHQNITEQQSYSRYKQNIFDQFLFQSIEKDSCSIFNQYYSVYQVQNYTYDYTKCQQLLNGVFQSGLMNTIQSFIEPFNIIYQLESIKDFDQWYKQINYVFNHEYNFFDIKEAFEMMVLMFDSLSQFINKTNDDFFSFMQNIQTSLMIYQITILTITFYYLFFFYFNSLQSSIQQTKKILSLIEAKYLQENHYILNYFKQ
ncbi:hypothetical protein ABPG74_015341 [Tetrahymena malaccensis]